MFFQTKPFYFILYCRPQSAISHEKEDGRGIALKKIVKDVHQMVATHKTVSTYKLK